MYVVRRHSRKLFFPAGLLALAWLLCLGCALLAGRPELRRLRQRVLQMSMPPLKPPLSSAADQTRGQPTWALPKELYASPARLDTMHPWHTVQFTGNVWQDDLSIRTATFVARQLHADPNHDRGLRIQFGPRSQYRSLVAMLNMFGVVGLKKYWLDTQHRPTALYPTALYSYTVPVRPQPKPLPQPPVFICGTSDMVIEVTAQLPPAPFLLHHFIPAASWRYLLTWSWRYSTLLLLLLPLAAAWQLRRLTTANR